MTQRVPLRAPHAPCVTCPYRRDVPSGVWAREEYEKLPAYDLPTPDQPTGVFCCHTDPGRVCGGWAACHDLDHSLSVRVGTALGYLDAHALTTYTTTVPVWDSGLAAHDRGVADVDDPGPAALAAIARWERRR